MENSIYKNKLCIEGIVTQNPIPLSLNKYGNFYTIFVAVKQLNDKFNYLELRLPEHLLTKEELKNLKGKGIKVKGRLNSFTFKKKNDNKDYTFHIVSVKSIKIIEIQDLKYINQVNIIGKIISDSITIISLQEIKKVEFKIKVYSISNKSSIIKCCCFGSNADKLIALKSDSFIESNGFLKSHKNNLKHSLQEFFITNFEYLEESN